MIRNPEDSTSILCSIIFSIIIPFDDFMDISGTTHPNLAYDSHSFKAVSHPSLSPVIDQAIFPFISYFSHDESLCFHFITHFLSDLSSDSSCTYHFCNMAVLSGMFSDSCRNVALSFMFPPVYKEAVLPQRKDNLQCRTLSPSLSVQPPLRIFGPSQLNPTKISTKILPQYKNLEIGAHTNFWGKIFVKARRSWVAPAWLPDLQHCKAVNATQKKGLKSLCEKHQVNYS